MGYCLTNTGRSDNAIYRLPQSRQQPGIPLPAGYTERHHWRVKYPPGDPLHRLKKGASAPVARLTPVIQVEGNDVILMTHEMASVRVKQLGQAVMDASPFRHTIKSAVDFLLDGF